MDDHFKRKITQDIENSGFGSQMKAVRQFLNRGWACTGGAYFFDRDEQKTREIDFTAHHVLHPEGIDCFFYIVGEVKKSNKPWVVFKRIPIGFTDAWNNLIFCNNVPLTRKARLVEEMSRNSLLAQCGWDGYGLHESFKKPDQPSRWYSAFVSACKAAEDMLTTPEAWGEEIKNGIKVWEPEKLVCLDFVKPVVTLDGVLLSAEMLDDGSIEVEEINAAPVSFEYRSKQYNRKYGYAVDVVKLDALDHYLEGIEKRHQDIVDGIIRLVTEAAGG